MHLFNLKSSTILASFHFLDTASEKARGALINNFVTAVSVICRNLIRIFFFFGGGEYSRFSDFIQMMFFFRCTLLGDCEHARMLSRRYFQ